MFVIRARNGELVNGGDRQFPFVFRTRDEAKRWLVRGDVIEEMPRDKLPGSRVRAW